MSNETATPETKKQGKVLQIVLSVLLFAGFAAFLFVPDLVVYETSLWSQILNLFKKEFLGEGLIKIAMYGFIGFYALLIICTVVSFFTKRRAALVFNYIKTIAGLAAILLFLYALLDEGFTLRDLIFSSKTGIALNSAAFLLFFSLLGLIVLNFSAYKGFGFAKLIFALLAAAFFVFAQKYTFIEEYTFADLFTKPQFGDGLKYTLTTYGFYVLGWAVLANFGLALLTLIFPKMSVIDLIRSVLIFVVAAFAFVMLGITSSFTKVFDQIGTIGMLGLSLAQLIYAIVLVCVLHSRKKKRAAEPFVFDANNQMAVKGFEAQPAADATADEKPIVAEEPEKDPEADKMNEAFETASQISIEEIEKQAEAEVSAPSDYESVIRDTPVEPETAAKEDVAEEKPFDFNQAKYDGQFNREYTDYAQQEEQKAQKQESANVSSNQQQTAYGYSAPPYYGTQPQYPPQQPAGAYYGYNTGFIPDPFLASLTPQERDEFDRLFISRIYGDNKRLPAYHIGGDNREFFAKIFVFMGRYRNVISDGLLEKIYNYSNSVK